MQHLEMMQHEANLHKGLHGGHVRIAAFRSVATHLLPKAMPTAGYAYAQFHDQFSEVAITIIECSAFTDVEQCLRDGRADIGITLQVPAVFTFLDMLKKFDFYTLAKSTY